MKRQIPQIKQTWSLKESSTTSALSPQGKTSMMSQNLNLYIKEEKLQAIVKDKHNIGNIILFQYIIIKHSDLSFPIDSSMITLHISNSVI